MIQSVYMPFFKSLNFKQGKKGFQSVIHKLHILLTVLPHIYFEDHICQGCLAMWNFCQM